MHAAILALLLNLLAVPSDADGPCEGEVACQLGDRSYHLRVPDDWDGVTPMPVLLHFHGWQRQGTLIVRHARIAGGTRRRGVLLLAPNGLRRTWDFWGAGSDDVDFAAAVIEDAAKRYPIDRSHIYVSGYSYGSAMAWRFVCEAGKGIAGLIAVSGIIRNTEACVETPAHVRHTHGLSDTVLRFPMGEGEDITAPVAHWREAMGCGDAEDHELYNIRPFLTFERVAWDCAEGTVTLDIHPGGHFIPHGWIGWQLDELMGRDPAYP